MYPEHPSKLHRYQTIADITRRMLAHAESGEWDRVTELAPDYHAAVEALRGLTLHAVEIEARRALLTEILENDAAIRDLASPELGRLRLLIGSLQRQRTVLQAYCAPEPD